MDQDNPESFDLFVSLGGKRVALSPIILLLSSLAFIPSILPMLNPGPPINTDIGVHVSLAACIKETGQWLLPTAWCTHGQAGLARLQRYALTNQFLTRILDVWLPVDISFKIVMILFFVLLPVNAYLLLRWIGYPLAGAMAFAFLLLDPGAKVWGGYALHFVIGSFITNGAASLSPLTLLAILWFLRNPSLHRSIFVAAAAAIHFLTHPGAFMWMPIALIPVGFFWRRTIRTHFRLVCACALFFFLFTGFWVIPAVAKASYFTLPGIGLSYITQTDFAALASHFTFAQQLLIIISIAAVILILASSKTKEVKLVAALPPMVALAWGLVYLFPDFFYFKYLMIDRTIFEARTFLVLSASLLLGGALIGKESRYRRQAALAGLFLFLTLSASFFLQQWNVADAVSTGADAEPYLPLLYRPFNGADGRILVETFFYQVNRTSQVSQAWSLSGLYSGKEFLGNGDFWYSLDDYSIFYKGFLFHRHLTNYTNQDLLGILERLNVQYIIAFSPAVMERFSGLLAVTKGLGTPLGVVIYETPFNHSFFSYPAGVLANTHYEKIRASAIAESENGGILFFKVRHWPNWKAWIDEAPAPIRKGTLGLMEVDVPKGKHKVRFAYGLIWVDWAGYMITLAGILLAGWILLAPHTKTHSNT